MKWLDYFLKKTEWSCPFRVNVSQSIVRAKHNESSYILSKLKYIILPWMFCLLSWKWKQPNLCSTICWSFLTQHWFHMPLVIKTMPLRAYRTPPWPWNHHVKPAILIWEKRYAWLRTMKQINHPMEISSQFSIYLRISTFSK